MRLWNEATGVLAASLALCFPTLRTNAQPVSRVRKVGIMMPYPATDTEVQGRVTAFREELRSLGWRADENVEFDERWTTDNMDRVRAAGRRYLSCTRCDLDHQWSSDLRDVSADENHTCRVYGND